MPQAFTYLIQEADASLPLERILSRASGLEEWRWIGWLKRGLVMAGAERMRPGWRKPVGTLLTLATDLDVLLQEAPRPGKKLHVLFQNDELAVVDKPAGLSCHPAGALAPGTTLIERFRQQFPSKSRSAFEPQLVHRLDADTSGLVVVALRADALERWNKAFATGQVHKTYVAATLGQVPADEGLCDMPLAFQRGKASVDSLGKAAQTKWRLLKKVGEISLIELKPLTGRPHQLRVHMAALGAPLLGDRVYDTKPGLQKCQALHVRRLCLHARTLEAFDLRFESPLPEPFLGWMSL